MPITGHFISELPQYSTRGAATVSGLWFCFPLGRNCALPSSGPYGAPVYNNQCNKMFPCSLVLDKTEHTFNAIHWTFNLDSVEKRARNNIIFCSNFTTFMFFQWSCFEMRYYCPFSYNKCSKFGWDPNLGHYYKVGHRENLPFHCSSPILLILHVWTNVPCSHMTQKNKWCFGISNAKPGETCWDANIRNFFKNLNGWLVKHIFCSHLVRFHVELMHGPLLLCF